jgi:hypothetical protein
MNVCSEQELTVGGIVYVRYNLGALKGRRFRAAMFAAEILSIEGENVNVNFLTHHNHTAAVPAVDCWKVDLKSNGLYVPSDDDIVAVSIVEDLDGQPVRSHSMCCLPLVSDTCRLDSQLVNWTCERYRCCSENGDCEVA